MALCEAVSTAPGMEWPCHREAGHGGSHEAWGPSPAVAQVIHWSTDGWALVPGAGERETRDEVWLGTGRGWRPVTVGAMYVPPDAPRRMVERWVTQWVPIEEGTDGVPH